MRRPNFATPTFGSRVDACQWTDDLDATPVQWCADLPVYEVSNRYGRVFLSCVEHAYQARMDPTKMHRLASIRTVKAPR